MEIMELKANIFDKEHVVKGVHPLDLKEEEQRNFDIVVKEHREEQIKILDEKIYATVKKLVPLYEEKKLLLRKLTTPIHTYALNLSLTHKTRNPTTSKK
tara:strand:- start:118 stop:414 length:297 start_codon:yes stop_codon:yes gene_type:complete